MGNVCETSGLRWVQLEDVLAHVHDEPFGVKSSVGVGVGNA